MLDLKVNGRATAGCRQPHMVTGVNVDMAKVCLQLRNESQLQTVLLSSPIPSALGCHLLLQFSVEQFCKPSIDSFDRTGSVRTHQPIC